MTQARIIRGSERVSGGYRVRIEVTEAYTDGSSRFEHVFVPEEDVAQGDENALLEAVAKSALDAKPLERVKGVDVVAFRRLGPVVKEMTGRDRA